MLRRYLTIAAVFTAGFIAAMGYSFVTRPDSAQRVAEPAPIATSAVPVVAAQPVPQPEPVLTVAEEQPALPAEPAATEAPPPDKMDQLLADARSDDAKKRAAAIAAMASAPKAQAVPVLQGLLISAEPQVDLPLALRSLRTLAQREGDADGRIRDALRYAIYHGNDEATTQAVQEALGEVESANNPALPAPNVRTRG
ncbi:MAG: hypothetical protein WDO56_03260 [Gammaproteobacteria bacterium]